METAKIKPENSKVESTKHDNVLELVLIGLLVAVMGLAS